MKLICSYLLTFIYEQHPFDTFTLGIQNTLEH